MKSISQAELHRVIRYVAETGEFFWLITNSHRAMAGNPAGTFDKRDGRRYIRIHGQRYAAYRLAVLYMTGVLLPSKVEVDHQDGDCTNDKWDNLREASRMINAQNLHQAKSNSTTGFLGVAVCRGKFRAMIKWGGKTRVIGTYATPELAHQAYLMEKRLHHEGNKL